MGPSTKYPGVYEDVYEDWPAIYSKQFPSSPFCFANSYIGYTYWIPYLLPYAIWGSFILLVLVSYGLLKCFRGFGRCLWSEHLTPWLAFIFALNGSLCIWIIYILIFYHSCEHHGDWPRFFSYHDADYNFSLAYFFFTAIFLASHIIVSLYDAITMTELKFVRECVDPDEASEYLETLKASAPRQRVLVEVFHEDVDRPRYGRVEGTQSRMNTRNFEGTIEMGEIIKNKVVTFTEDRDFDYDTWHDPTNYPDIKNLLQENPYLKIEMNPCVEPGDDTTKQLLETFKTKLTTSCGFKDQMVRDELEGIVPASKFVEMAVKNKEGVSFWFTWWGLLLACLLSVSVFVRVLLNIKIKRISLNINKKFYADPANVRRYDFEDSVPELGVVNGGADTSSLLPGHKTSNKPSPAPTHNQMDYIQVAPAPSGEGSMADQIEKLHKLKLQGVLTEDEFSLAKSRLIYD